MDIAVAALNLWAKSGDPFHPLLAHMLDTAAVAWAILEREPGRTRKLYAADWELGEEEALRWVAFLAGLHDLGKASPVFQAAWEEGAQRVWDSGLTWNRELVKESWVAHGVFTELYVKEALEALKLPGRISCKIAKALGAHHGFLARGDELRKGRLHVRVEEALWKEVRNHLVQRLAKSLGLALPLGVGVRDLAEPGALRVMALASFADWIASDPNFFPYGRNPAHEGYWQEALSLARKALEALPWPSLQPGGVRPFEALFPFPPNPLQASVVEALGASFQEPTLLLVEAPMGLGKTEAALYAYHVLREQLDHRGLYVALPTQATANGLFSRVRDFLENLAVGQRWELQLQHGAAPLNPLYAELQEKAMPTKVYEGGRGEEGGVAASAWFSAKKRAMLAGHGVGTLDQALLGVLRVKHHFIRLWGLMNRVVVLDEVHAYDTYTSGLLKSLLTWLKALGSSVVLMTATLPQGKREELLRAWLGDGQGNPSLSLPPYPRVCAFGQGGMVAGRTFTLEGKTLLLEAAPVEVRELADALKARLPGVVGAIVNTVDRAQNLYQALGEGERVTLEELLEGLGPGPNGGTWPDLLENKGEKGQEIVGKRLADGTWVFLLHARFPAEERALREAIALALFGKHGPRPEKAILVATQVAEQSLDLDFDYLYSDLAPIDLLLQRAGRLHRHPRRRPEGHEKPVLGVGGLVGSKGEDGPSFGGELHWDKVYEDYVLLSTWFSLKGRDQVALPQDLEGLLQEVYERLPEAFPQGLRARAQKAYEKLRERAMKDSRIAENLALARLERLLSGVDAAALVAGLGLDDEEEKRETQRLLTRLGDPAVSVVPLYRQKEGWSLDPEGRHPARLEGQLQGDEVLALWSRAVRLSRHPIPRSLWDEDPPPAWHKSGLLRGLRLLEVGRTFPLEKGALRVELDPELGVVYRRV
ncbi:CRISPR-associated helicase Cas3' [Thermus sp.]|uniref:CRISPR-associated helicase Cas3' n=1 Tax=Thermus sp. TaxID=275 RepID=UPI003918F8C4